MKRIAFLLFFSLWSLLISFCTQANEFPLTIIANPPDSRIRIMNIRLEYQPEILLPPGHYEIEVSHAGYIAVQQRVEIVNQGVTVQITLAKPGNNSLTPAAPLVKPGEIQKLIEQLGDRYKLNAAISRLVTIGQSAVEPLMAALKDGYGDLRRATVEALVKIGQPAVKPLIAALKDNNKYVRLTVAKALGRIGDKQAIAPLTAALKDSDKSVRMSAVEALGQIGDKRVTAPLTAMLKDSDKSVRLSTVEVLGQIGDKRVTAPLTAMLKDRNDDVRIAAAYALGKIGDSRAVKPLTVELKDGNEEIRTQAAKSLVSYPASFLIRNSRLFASELPWSFAFLGKQLHHLDGCKLVKFMPQWWVWVWGSSVIALLSFLVISTEFTLFFFWILMISFCYAGGITGAATGMGPAAIAVAAVAAVAIMKGISAAKAGATAGMIAGAIAGAIAGVAAEAATGMAVAGAIAGAGAGVIMGAIAGAGAAVGTGAVARTGEVARTGAGAGVGAIFLLAIVSIFFIDGLFVSVLWENLTGIFIGIISLYLLGISLVIITRQFVPWLKARKSAFVCGMDYHRTKMQGISWIARWTNGWLAFKKYNQDLTCYFVCRTCGNNHRTQTFLRNIDKIVGFIGGKPGEWIYLAGKENCLGVSLFSFVDKQERSADIDRLEIHSPSSVTEQNYDHAVTAVDIALSNDPHRTRKLEQIPVILHGSPPLSENTLRILRNHFMRVEIRP
ncbi:MAG: hypothetical protein GY862_33495 [Gammaproteobacteria bacterium]|nr:hypothetical protein [Gammaproteobacteria bacterium]